MNNSSLCNFVYVSINMYSVGRCVHPGIHISIQMFSRVFGGIFFFFIHSFYFTTSLEQRTKIYPIPLKIFREQVYVYMIAYTCICVHAHSTYIYIYIYIYIQKHFLDERASWTIISSEIFTDSKLKSNKIIITNQIIFTKFTRTWKCWTTN